MRCSRINCCCCAEWIKKKKKKKQIKNAFNTRDNSIRLLEDDEKNVARAFELINVEMDFLRKIKMSEKKAVRAAYIQIELDLKVQLQINYATSELINKLSYPSLCLFYAIFLPSFLSIYLPNMSCRLPYQFSTSICAPISASSIYLLEMYLMLIYVINTHQVTYREWNTQIQTIMRRFLCSINSDRKLTQRQKLHSIDLNDCVDYSFTIS